MLALVRTELQRQGVVLHTDLTVDQRPVFGDRVQLQQVLLNLIINGIEAMSAVTERTRELMVSAAFAEPGTVLVAVEYTGPGLDEAGNVSAPKRVMSNVPPDRMVPDCKISLAAWFLSKMEIAFFGHDV